MNGPFRISPSRYTVWTVLVLLLGLLACVVIWQSFSGRQRRAEFPMRVAPSVKTQP